jgi:hypothetical protein
MTTDLVSLQRDTFGYFLDLANEANGLVPDNSRAGSHCSIAAVGLGLATLPVAVERGFISRALAVKRVLAAERFFRDARHDGARDSTGYHGFYFHFLDMERGRRAWHCELSTIDSAFLLAGMLACATYFDRDTPGEREIRATAEELYARADWNWACDGGAVVSHGWRPERGFIPYGWTGYNEALLLLILGLGSPSHPLPVDAWTEWTRTYRWKKLYGQEHVYGGPLFVHQLSHAWIDFRGIRDDYMRNRGIDYFENSRRATYLQREHAIHNPRELRGFGRDVWGVTATDGPGPARRVVDGRERRFYGYRARGVPWGRNDGTIAPWSAVATLPFAPEIALSAVEAMRARYPQLEGIYGLRSAFNPTFDVSGSPGGWVSDRYYGIEQGPAVLMIENHLTGFFWDLMKQCPHVARGLKRAGFRGGWLGER